MDNWNFDTFALHRVSKGTPLRYLGYELLTRHGCLHKYKVKSTFSPLICDIFILKWLLNSIIYNIHNQRPKLVWFSAKKGEKICATSHCVFYFMWQVSSVLSSKYRIWKWFVLFVKPLPYPLCICILEYESILFGYTL